MQLERSYRNIRMRKTDAKLPAFFFALTLKDFACPYVFFVSAFRTFSIRFAIRQCQKITSTFVVHHLLLLR